MIAIPRIIFLPYVKAFNFLIKGFKNPDFLYDPVALAGMALENRLVFASGLFDFGTKLIPQLSIILSLVTVGEHLGHSGAAVVPPPQVRKTTRIGSKAPASTINMQFSETNLTALPDDLYKRWHSLVPYRMFFSRVYRLSFMGNQITTIPSVAMMPPRMVIPDLRLKDNPLQQLPATLMAPDAMIMSLNV